MGNLELDFLNAAVVYLSDVCVWISFVVFCRLLLGLQHRLMQLDNNQKFSSGIEIHSASRCGKYTFCVATGSAIFC